MAFELKNFEFYFFGTNLGTMCDKFLEEISQFSNFCFWQLTTCQTIAQWFPTTTMGTTSAAKKNKFMLELKLDYSTNKGAINQFYK